jgi:hypothetical protein
MITVMGWRTPDDSWLEIEEEDEEEGCTNMITVRGGGHLMIPG